MLECNGAEKLGSNSYLPPQVTGRRFRNTIGFCRSQLTVSPSELELPVQTLLATEALGWGENLELRGVETRF